MIIIYISYNYLFVQVIESNCSLNVYQYSINKTNIRANNIKTRFGVIETQWREKLTATLVQWRETLSPPREIVLGLIRLI